MKLSFSGVKASYTTCEGGGEFHGGSLPRPILKAHVFKLGVTMGRNEVKRSGLGHNRCKACARKIDSLNKQQEQKEGRGHALLGWGF